jgi:hypothetical protein
VDEELECRLGANEAVFRTVNEGIVRGQWPGEGAVPIGFRCECAQLGCNRLLNLTLDEYEHVRAEARRFVVIPGHQLPSVETVLEAHDGYVIVEKRGQAGEEAAALDPRSKSAGPPHPPAA